MPHREAVRSNIVERIALERRPVRLLLESPVVWLADLSVVCRP
jgi:hypothetical protein